MTPKSLPAEREIVRDAATFCGPIVAGMVEYGEVSFWHIPAVVGRIVGWASNGVGRSASTQR